MLMCKVTIMNHLTRNRSVMSSKHSKGSFIAIEQETLSALLSTGWY